MVGARDEISSRSGASGAHEGTRGSRRADGRNAGWQTPEGDHHDQRTLLDKQGGDHARPQPDRVEVELELDLEPRVVVEPADFATALDAEPLARSAFDRLTDSQKSQHLRLIENAKKPDTRARRIEKMLATLRDSSATSAGSSRT